MKRVVLVAPEFPPANTAGAHRPRLLAKHLPEFGWSPTVVTIRADRIEGPLDPLLETLVDPALRVIRTGALPVRPVRLIGDLGLRAALPHARALAALAHRGEIDALVLFGPPWFSFIHGPILQRRFGIPYLLDYIDPWISDWTASHRFPTKGWLYHRAAALVEPVALRSASFVTAVSRGMLEAVLAAYPAVRRDRTAAMPYGCEPDDVAASARAGVMPPDFRRECREFTVAFTGAIQPHGRELLRALLCAVRAIRDSRSPLGSAIRLRFYGTSNLTWGHDRFAVRPLAQELGMDDIVSERPERVPYLTAMAVLRDASLTVVFGSTEPSYSASKLYPALAAGRPILAVCHEQSAMRKTLDEAGAGVTVTFSSVADVLTRVDAIRAGIEELAARPRAAIPAAVERFTARASTAVLARALDVVIGGAAVSGHRS